MDRWQTVQASAGELFAAWVKDNNRLHCQKKAVGLSPNIKVRAQELDALQAA